MQFTLIKCMSQHGIICRLAFRIPGSSHFAGKEREPLPALPSAETCPRVPPHAVREPCHDLPGKSQRTFVKFDSAWCQFGVATPHGLRLMCRFATKMRFKRCQRHVPDVTSLCFTQSRVESWSCSVFVRLRSVKAAAGKFGHWVAAKRRAKEDALLVGLTELLQKFAPKDDAKANRPQHKAKPGEKEIFEVPCRQCSNGQVPVGHS